MPNLSATGVMYPRSFCGWWSASKGSGGLRPFEASRLASLTPATLMGIDNRKGSIRIGKDADFVLTDEHFDLCGVFVGGEDAFEGAAC